MLKPKTLERVILEAVRLQGQELNGQELLIIRTRVATALSAKERHRRRMDAKLFQWQKPERHKR